jgi:hypothetical protein
MMKPCHTWAFFNSYPSYSPASSSGVLRTMNFFRRSFLAGMTLCSMLVSIPAGSVHAEQSTSTAACPVVTGQPYRSPDSSTVYVVTPDCKKRPVFNPDVYFSHFDSWSKVVFLEPWELSRILNHELNFLPWGSRRAFLNGSLVKTTDDPRVYLLQDGQALPIEDEAAFRAFGYSFNQVEDVDANVMKKFEKKTDTLRGPEDAPTAMVFKYPDDSKVYQLKEEEDGTLTKVHIQSEDELRKLYRDDRIPVFLHIHVYPEPRASGTVDANRVSSSRDITAPTVTISVPDENDVLSGLVALEAVASDNVGVTQVQFLIDNMAVRTDTRAPYKTTLDTKKFTNGAHTLTAIAKDKAGNTGTDSIPVTISNNQADTVAPTIAITSPAEGATVSGTVTIQATASDNVGVTQVQFLVGTTVIATDTSAPYETPWNTVSSSIANGNNTLYAVAKDAAGNSTTVTRSVIVANAVPDTTAPAVSLTSPAGGATVNGSVTITADASDNIAVAQVAFYIDDRWIDTDDSAPYSISWDSTAYANGNHTISAVSRDTSENNSAPSSRSVTVSNGSSDTVNPTVAITAPASGATVSGSVTVSADASDNVGVTQVTFLANNVLISTDTSAPYSASWNTLSLTNGTYTLAAISRDAAGNASPTSTRTVTVANTAPDTTNPTVAITAPASGATVSGTISIDATASDNVGVTQVQFLVGSTVISTDTSAPYSASWNTTSYANGSYTLSAVARDAAGNSSTVTRTVTVSNAVADTTNPSVSFTAPASGATVSGTVTVSADASDNVGVTQVQFLVGTTVIATDTSAPYSASWNTTSQANGGYVLSAVARDAAGNSATVTRTVTVANTVPDPVTPPTTVACVHTGSGTDYQVGPGKTYAEVTDVPWENVTAGDTVRIFWRANAYKSKVLISGKGTTSQPIRVCGVPGPNGERPVFDGDGARARLGMETGNAVHEQRGIFMVRNKQSILTNSYYAAPPSNIIIEGFEIKNANPNYSFTSSNGSTMTYGAFGGCIWLEQGHGVTLRNNEIHNCTNGIFSRSAVSPGDSWITKDVLIEGNYIYANGTHYSDGYTHGTYIQSSGVVYQFNHYGPLAANSPGTTLKDRSVGSVVRYNRFEGGSIALDLVEAEDWQDYAMADPRYRETFVYGNVIKRSNTGIHYGGDHFGGVEGVWGYSIFRKGTLYYYNNTHELTGSDWMTSFFRLSTSDEKAQVFNNVFWYSGNPPNLGFRECRKDGSVFYETGGVITLGKNVIKTGWAPDPAPTHPCPAEGIVTGAQNMVTTLVAPINATDGKLVSGSPAIDSAQAPIAAVAAHPVIYEYTPDLKGRARTTVGAGMDMGAFEYSP